MVREGFEFAKQTITSPDLGLELDTIMPLSTTCRVSSISQ
jgi:hypothetical protein